MPETAEREQGREGYGRCGRLTPFRGQARVHAVFSFMEACRPDIFFPAERAGPGGNHGMPPEDEAYCE